MKPVLQANLDQMAGLVMMAKMVRMERMVKMARLEVMENLIRLMTKRILIQSHRRRTKITK